MDIANKEDFEAENARAAKEGLKLATAGTTRPSVITEINDGFRQQQAAFEREVLCQEFCVRNSKKQLFHIFMVSMLSCQK